MVSSIISIYLFILIKHCIDILTLKSFTISQFYEHIYIDIPVYEFQDAIYIKHLSEMTLEVWATAERGARFHPTIGSTTPNGFTTSHPRAETTML
jgi:hypothetical protein